MREPSFDFQFFEEKQAEDFKIFMAGGFRIWFIVVTNF
jgi:hypothetical protein